MPLIVLFRIAGLVLVVVGLLNMVMGLLPANIGAMVPHQLMLVEGFAQSVSLFGLGAMIYLLGEIAAKRAPKSY